MMSFFGEAFCGAASDVVDGGLVAHSYDGYSVERRVGLSVPASVKDGAGWSVLTRPGWDRRRRVSRTRPRSGSVRGCRRTR